MIKKTFNILKALVWPIQSHENKRLLPLLAILFLLAFNHCILWNLKDSLMVTAAGAEVIPFIKVWGILPGAILLTCIYAKLSNHFSQHKVFHLMVSCFLLFFGLFAFVIYPLRDQLHPFESAAYLETILLPGFKGIIAMYRYWTYSVFYVICELWNTIVITVLFWGLANAITQLTEARRFYGVLSMGYNIAVVAAGGASLYVARSQFINNILPTHMIEWEKTMTVLVCVVMLSGILAMVLFHRFSLAISVEPKIPSEVTNEKSDKPKLTFLESLWHVCRSHYLISIAVIVISYGVAINMVEVVWKDQLRNIYPTPSEYNSYINTLQMIQGAIAIVVSLCMSELINRFGWLSRSFCCSWESSSELSCWPYFFH